MWQYVPHPAHGRLRDYLKTLTLPARNTYSVSKYIQQVTIQGGGIMPNPYDDDVFRTPGAGARPRELLFVGRLDPIKGLDVLLRAVALLHRQGETHSLTVVGDGPEMQSSRDLAHKLQIDAVVQFCGALRGEELAHTMRQHRIMIVPSRPRPSEAFGIVALEGLASGCQVIASDQGGLPEAVGDLGVLVEPERPEQIARAITELSDGIHDPDVSALRRHLQRHSAHNVVIRYEAAARLSNARRTRVPIVKRPYKSRSEEG